MTDRTSPEIRSPLVFQDKPVLDEDAEFSIDQTFRIYGKFDGLQLSYLTHKEDTPWRGVFSGKNKIISEERIGDYFKQLFDIEHRSAK